MAKRRKSDRSKTTTIAVVVGILFAIYFFGGQFTGLATSHATDFDLTISEVTSCTIASAPTSVSCTGGTAATCQPAGDGTMTNNGNVELQFKVQANETVNALFSQGTTVAMDALAGSGSTTLTDLAAITTSAVQWCDDVATAETCLWDFNIALTAAEATGTYEFQYTITCVAA